MEQKVSKKNNILALQKLQDLYTMSARITVEQILNGKVTLDELSSSLGLDPEDVAQYLLLRKTNIGVYSDLEQTCKELIKEKEGRTLRR